MTRTRGLASATRAANLALVDGDVIPPVRPSHRRGFELSTSGVDDALVGFSSDPYSRGYPQSVGLRIPPVLPGDTGPQTRPRYLFCLATRTLRGPTRLKGIRQGLTLGVDLNYGTPPFRPIELGVCSPSFKFIDGNVSWHLVMERAGKLKDIQPLTDTNNWRRIQADGSAMLYNTFTNSAVTPSGAPILYMRGLTAYTPPEVQANWQAIDANLSCFYDLRFPWESSRALDALDYELDANARVSLYASVLQTNPALRTPGPSAPIPPGTSCEEAFITSYSKMVSEAIQGPIYWRIFGSLIFEDLV